MPLRATGPFLNLPTYYARVDTAGAVVDVSQSFVEADWGNSTVLAFETGLRTGERTRTRLQLSYPVIREEQLYDHGFGDLLLNAEIRLKSDTTGVSGLFIRGDMRIPTGSKSRWPYAGESLDGGLGLELRRLSETFDLRASATYILVGRRLDEPGYRSDNYALAGALLGIRPLGAVSLEFSVYAQFFRNGDFREIYMLTAATRLKGGLDVRISAGADSGGDYERVWNSMFQVGVSWRFPGAPEKRTAEGEQHPPGAHDHENRDE
jgi:hypothetical protein